MLLILSLLLLQGMMLSIHQKDIARLGVDEFECRPDGRSTLYFVVQGFICILSSIIVGSIPKRIWSTIPRVLKLYITLSCGPWLGAYVPASASLLVNPRGYLHGIGWIALGSN